MKKYKYIGISMGLLLLCFICTACAEKTEKQTDENVLINGSSDSGGNESSDISLSDADENTVSEPDNANADNIYIPDILLDDKDLSSKTSNEEDANDSGIMENSRENDETGASNGDEKNNDNDVQADIDLTVLSSIMVYSEVYNMVYEPENYIGKSVKMNGINAMFYDESKDKYYFGCIIMDATACCSQGIEYELTDEFKIPDDYPEEGEEICVYGIFDTYEEDSLTYCTLREAKLLKE